MIPTAAAAVVPSEVRERIIVALDVPTVDEARSITRELNGSVGAFKVGMQLFTAGGPEFVEDLASAGQRVFLDLKFHDIPNTVANAGVEAAKLGVWMFNVHASGGREMMNRTAEAVRENCERAGTAAPLIIGVTVLTSSDESTLHDVGIGSPVEEQVVRLARLAHASGIDGVVASPREVGLIRTAVTDPGFLTVTPGIRQGGATLDDQRRVTGIGEALAGGSDYVVIGRPILNTPDRRAAVEALVAEAGDHT